MLGVLSCPHPDRWSFPCILPRPPSLCPSLLVEKPPTRHHKQIHVLYLPHKVSNPTTFCCLVNGIDTNSTYRTFHWNLVICIWFDILALLDSKGSKNHLSWINEILGSKLRVLVQNKIIKHSHRSIDATLEKFFELNIIEDSNEPPSSPVLAEQSNVSHKPWLSPSEAVHWAVRQRCDENCPDCYKWVSSIMVNGLTFQARGCHLWRAITMWCIRKAMAGGPSR